MDIGFIGLGNMGMPMALRLVRAGHQLVGYNRTKARAEELERRGGAVATSLAEAAKGEVVITMLSDDRAVESVAFGKGSILETMNPHAIHLSMSTISPALSRGLAREHAARGQGYVAATVLGRPEAAERGELFVLYSGESKARGRVEPLFGPIGQRAFDLGDDPGAANIVKLSCNFLIAAVIESLSEAFALVRKANCIEPGQFLEILTGTLFSGSVFEVYGRHVLKHDFKPGFKVPLALKDIELGIAAGKEISVPLPLASMIRDHFITSIARGRKELDWSSLALIALEAAGMSGDEEGAVKKSA